MFLTTRAIVIHATRYSDTSLVVKILTEEAGLGSYIIKGARGPKAKIKASLFQPLTLLHIVVNRNEKSDLSHLREAHVAYSYRNMHQDIRKSSILLFINELIYKSIQEEAVNPELFRYIYDHLVMLDQTEENVADFHLLFMIHLSAYLGFFPQGSTRGDQTVFNLQEGLFMQTEPLPSAQFITGSACQWLERLLYILPGQFHTIRVPSTIRHLLLEKMIVYYHLHLPLTGSFKSHLVLREVLQG